MRKARLLIAVAALVMPLLWTGTLWAAEVPSAATTNEINPGDPGPGGGIAPETEPTVKIESTTITGTVVGTNCWLARGLEGDKYRDSAIACARNGTPLSIVTDAGELVYPILVGNSGSYQPDMNTLMKYAEQRVKVTGKLIKRGKERGIVIDQITSAPEPKKARTFATTQTPNADIVGTVVDLSMWIEKGSTGTTDAKLVGACAAAGDPLVIVTGNGRVYYPVSMTMPTSPVGRAWLSDYCARKVRVTGTTIARGEARGIVISKVVPVTPKK